MKRPKLQVKPVLALIALIGLSVLLWSRPALALGRSLDASQYAHTAWTVRSGAIKGNIYAMAQTPVISGSARIPIILLRWCSQYPLATTCVAASP